MEYLFKKHEGSYRAHAPDLLREKETLIRDLTRANAALELN